MTIWLVYIYGIYGSPCHLRTASSKTERGEYQLDVRIRPRKARVEATVESNIRRFGRIQWRHLEVTSLESCLAMDVRKLEVQSLVPFGLSGCSYPWYLSLKENTWDRKESIGPPHQTKCCVWIYLQPRTIRNHIQAAKVLWCLVFWNTPKTQTYFSRCLAGLRTQPKTSQSQSGWFWITLSTLWSLHLAMENTPLK